jgi:hypothetical protein
MARQTPSLPHAGAARVRPEITCFTLVSAVSGGVFLSVG